MINNQNSPSTSNGQLSDMTDNELRDIKGFQSIIVPDWVWYLIGFACLLCLAWLVYKYIKSRNPEKILTLYELTIKKLENLNSSQNSKTFYLDYTEIIRVYLEERLTLHVLDKTAEELKPILMTEPRILSPQALLLSKIFYRADLAKFAKQEFSEEIKTQDIKTSIEIIETIENKIQEEEQNKLEAEKRGFDAIR